MPRFLQMPMGMTGRFALVLAIAILLELMGMLALHRWQDREVLDAARPQVIAHQLIDAVHIAEKAHLHERADLMQSISIDGLAINWVPNSIITDHSTTQSKLAETRARLLQKAPALTNREMRLSVIPGQKTGQRDLIGVLALHDGTFISFRVDGYMPAPPPLWLASLLHVILLLVVFGLALLMVRTLVRPLADLAAAADDTTRNHTQRIDPTGPAEVQRLARAFDAMQGRLVKVMQDNTQALISVSHDLRTPIQRLKLRASMLDDAETVHAIGQDLAEMETFIDGTLAYVRSGMDEEPRLIDIASTLNTLIDDTADQGVDIHFHGPESLAIHTRPTALIRMVQNLIENARYHANRIDVSLAPSNAAGAHIIVEDDGPGIPPEHWDEVVQPFRKLPTLDSSPVLQDRVRKGAGLGLAYVQRALNEQGGALRFGKSSRGGLKVEITLPDTRA